MDKPDDRLPRDTPLNPPAPETDDLAAELTGDQAPGDQVAYRREEEIEHEPDITDTEQYQGDLEVSAQQALHGLADTELREGETSDPDIAAEEGKTWVPPTDPPVVPAADEAQGARVAAGFGSSATDEPYDRHHRSAALTTENDTSARVREALRADSATNRYADGLVIGTIGDTVALRGVVDDIDDSDNVVEVASRVVGIDHVIDELEIRALW